MAVRVLFISSLNSARSQMAEAFLRELGGDAVEVSSAGSTAFGLDPRAVLVMAERGIDISGQRSNEVLEYIRPDGASAFDYLITVCRMEDRACPAFPGRATREYWPLDDPARGGAGERVAGLADASDDDGLAEFRRVRDEIEARVREWLESHRRKLHPRRRPQAVGAGG